MSTKRNEKIKRLKYNEATRNIDIIEEIPKTKSINKKDWITLILSILSIVISIGALGISYFQKEAAEKQTDVSLRQFNMDKKPVFE